MSQLKLWMDSRMTLNPRLGAVAMAALVAAALAPSQAAAQYINSGPSSSAAPAYVAQGAFNEQPLVTPRGDLSVYLGPLANPKFGTSEEAGLHMIRLPLPSFGESSDGGETAVFLQAGAAYGLAKGLELGLFTPAWLVAPEVANGDLPLFLTWASSTGNVDVALRNTVTIPLQEASVWRWNPGVHLMGRFEKGRFDLGAFFPMMFGDDDQFLASFDLPLRANIAATEQLFFGLETGLHKFDIAEGSNDLFLPLGLNAIYSLEAGEHAIDITAKFLWQSFVWLNAPEGISDRVLQDTYTISLGAVMHFDLTQSGSKRKSEPKTEQPREEPTQATPPPNPSNPSSVQGKPPRDLK